MKLSLVTGIEKIDDCIEYVVFQLRDAMFLAMCVYAVYFVTIANSPNWLFLFITIGCGLSALVLGGVMLYNTLALLGRLVNVSYWKFV